MACLNDVISENLRLCKRPSIVALHKFVFGYEGDRNNRQRLREFVGFVFAEQSVEYTEKMKYIENNLTEADLVSICNVLGISHNGEQLAVGIFRNLQEGNLLKCVAHGDEAETDDSSDDEVYEDMRSANNTATVNQLAIPLTHAQTKAAQNNINNNNGSGGSSGRPICDENDGMMTARFAISFRDVEESIRNFDGTNSIPVEVWVEEFDNQAELMRWSDFQRFLFAKKALKGIAKLFVASERALNSWSALKAALLSEFKSNVTSKQIHEALAQSKRGKNECVFEFFYRLKDISARGHIDDDAFIQYVIDGIDTKATNKTILYGAKNMSEFKEKLKMYKIIAEKEKCSNETPVRAQVNTKKEAKELTCFNCGDKGHVSKNCDNKEKGRKCFGCNSYGHIAKNCNSKKISDPVRKVNTVMAKKDIMRKTINIDNFSVLALFDTGSSANIMSSDIYKNLSNVQLNECAVNLTGFGKTANIKPLGELRQTIIVDDEKFDLMFYVVRAEYLDDSIIIGADFCLSAEIIINPSGLKIRKLASVSRNEELSVLNIDVTSESEDIDIGDNMSAAAKQEVRELVQNYKPLKSKTTNIEMRIILKDETPIFSRPRRMALTEQSIVDDQIEEWLDKNIIEESNSEFTSPIVLVKKRDGSARLCVDFRRINKVIVKDHFPLPLIEDQLDRLQEAKVFSTIDLKNGFFHVPVAEESRRYTSFVTQNGQYQFRKVPFGLSNSPGVFQRHVNAVFRHLWRKGIALPYVDDVIIPAKNEEEAVQNLKEVIETCKEYGLELNMKKCNFLKTRIQFLGHIIENQKLYPSPEKIEAVVSFKVPQTLKQLESFLGLTGYFRKFIPNYAIISKPLSDLTKKSIKFSMGIEEEGAVSLLKKLLTKNPVLSIYNQSYETEVHTDASIDGFGAVLLQKSPDDNQLHPVYFMSKKTTEAQRKYTSYELEILAVIEALTKFRVYVLGIHFKLVTDCNAFTKTFEKQSLCTRVARWILFLQEYDYTVEHRAGTRMKHVDALSRYPVLTITEHNICIGIEQAQANDEKLKAIKEIIRDNKKTYNDYFLKAGILYKLVNDVELLVVPKSMQRQIIGKAHDKGHFAAKKTKELICRTYYIPRLEEKIQEYIECCIPCITSNRKRGKQEGFLHPLQKDDVPLFTYHIDFLGPLESTHKDYKHIFSVIDSFTKFCWLYPTKSTTSSEVITRLNNQSAVFGNPAYIISDRGSAFTSQDFAKYCEEEGIKLIKTTTGLPRVNGQVERLNAVIISVLSKLSINDPSKWYKHVNKVQQAINSTFCRSIDTTPFELLVGTKMRTNEDLQLQDYINKEILSAFNDDRNDLRAKAKTSILKVQSENKRTYNLRRKSARRYNVGDLVAIKRTQFGSNLKLKPKFLGPYQIVKVKQNNSYDVQKVGSSDGPKNTTTCAEYVKPWPSVGDDIDSDEAFGANT